MSTAYFGHAQVYSFVIDFYNISMSKGLTLTSTKSICVLKGTPLISCVFFHKGAFIEANTRGSLALLY